MAIPQRTQRLRALDAPRSGSMDAQIFDLMRDRFDDQDDRMDRLDNSVNRLGAAVETLAGEIAAIKAERATEQTFTVREERAQEITVSRTIDARHWRNSMANAIAIALLVVALTVILHALHLV